MSARRPAKVPGRCNTCGKPFDDGALIKWHAGSGDFPPITYGPCWPACEATVRDYGSQNLAQSPEVDSDIVELECERCGSYFAGRLRGGPGPCRKIVPAGTCGGQLKLCDDVTLPVPEAGPAPRDGDPAGSSEGSAAPARSLFEDQLRKLDRVEGPAADAGIDAHATGDGDAGGGGGGARGAPGDPIPPGGEGRQS